VSSYTLHPQDFGYAVARVEDIAGGTPEDNARRLVEVMQGERSHARDIITMNSGAAVYVSGQATTLAEGIEISEAAIDSGEALKVLKQMVEINGEPGKLERFL